MSECACVYCVVCMLGIHEGGIPQESEGYHHDIFQLFGEEILAFGRSGEIIYNGSEK